MGETVNTNNITDKPKFGIKKVNRFLPYIALVGIGIGTANFIMNSGLNWIQWTIQSLATSFLIGYTTVVVASNKPWFKFNISPSWRLYVLVFFLFLLAGVFATEVEHMIRSLIFRSEPYEPFNAGKMYLFNGVISLFLGFSLFQNNYFFKNRESVSSESQEDEHSKNHPSQETSKRSDITATIPVKQGENVLLIQTEDVVYFEAYDNYSFVYDTAGKKRLCDYSLRFLEKKLEAKFSRVHRKYIVNERHIKQIRPHLNGRYLIEFSLAGLAPITSSKSYSDTIRKLIRIQ
ncbi:MAG: LytTR family DNA-binding domain-containing protein [Eudoraea sp.]|nr:LytTR family DNA-binding domain-containing protein [Eudoraea sp.]